LGHVIDKHGIAMDPTKVQAIVKWSPPKNVHEVCSFLGLASFYQKFIKGFSGIAVPLTNLTKQGQKFEWDAQCDEAFILLKSIVVSIPVLRIPTQDASFEVYTDASMEALDAVLTQVGHPCAFESKKLNNTEKNYLVHELELYAIIHVLRAWKHYLMDATFLVITDNVCLKLFHIQPSLSTRQAWWMDFLASFDFEIQYQLGKRNVVADALSRELSFTTINLIQSDLLVQLACQCVNDPSFEDVILKLKDTTIVKDKFPYELQGEVLLYKERLCLPSHGSW
jgi:hypothetical protein